MRPFRLPPLVPEEAPAEYGEPDPDAVPPGARFVRPSRTGPATPTPLNRASAPRRPRRRVPHHGGPLSLQGALGGCVDLSR